MLVIRQATSSDVDIVFELIKAIAQHHNQEQYVMTSKEELLKFGFSDNPSFGVLLAELTDEVAGYCSHTWNYSIWLGSVYMNIDDLFVWEKFRGQQIGERLMLKAKDLCVAKGANRIKWEVEQDNHAAIKFYQKLNVDVEFKGIFQWNI